MVHRIELNVLGRLEIRTEGEAVELRAKKARALLAYLAVENGLLLSVPLEGLGQKKLAAT